MQNPKISIIILNWNRWKDTIECLESLYTIIYPNYEIIVVDNGSTDGSVKKIKDWSNNKTLKYYEYTKKELENNTYFRIKRKIDKLSSNKKLFILKNEKNYGFAEGNNTAIKQILKEKSSKYVLVLNNDTVVHKFFLNELIKTIEANPRIGVVGPKILNYYNPNMIDSISILIDSMGGGFSEGHGKKDIYKNDKPVFGISGCCILISVDAIIKIIDSFGYFFDECFYLYYEDVDLAWRINLLGLKSYFSSKSKIYHKESKSSGKFSTFKSFYIIRNRLFITFKYYPFINLVTALKNNLKHYLLLFIANFKKNKYSKFVNNINKKNKKINLIFVLFKSYLYFLLNLIEILSKRRRIYSLEKIDKKAIKNLLKLYGSKD